MDSDRYDWRRTNLSSVVLVFVRAVGDPVLAWGVAMEGMAAASLAWARFPGGSRMAWVLEHGRRVLRDASESGRVSAHERRRNRVTARKVLDEGEQRSLLEQAGQPLDLDADAAAVADRLAREAPPPDVLRSIALSELTGHSARATERDGA